MSSATLNLNDKTYEYLLGNIMPESEAATALREATVSQHGRSSVMQISQEQGAFMKMLVKLLDIRAAIEVGTYTGYSALAVAEAMPADGIIVACDVSKSWTSLGREYWEKAGVAHKIQLHLRPATETLSQLISQGESGRFDFTFIDADKNNYDSYYESCLSLLKANGLIAIDNVLWGGRTADESVQDPDTKALRELNAKIKTDDRVEATMLPIGDGLTLCRKL